MSLLNLPNETIDKIFNYVSFDDLFNLELVNKRINKIVREISFPKIQTFDHRAIIKFTDYPEFPNYASTYDLKDYKLHTITNKSVETILSKANIRKLDLSVYIHGISDEVCSLLPMVPKLISLNLRIIRLEPSYLKTIADSCLLLEELDLEECFTVANKDEVAIELINVFQKCQNLKYLNLGYDNFNFLILALVPTQLRYLNINGLIDLTPGVMDVIVTRAPDLETLIFANYYPDPNFNARLRKLKKLKYLEVGHSINEDNHEFFPLLDFSNFMELEVLSLHHNEFVTVETLQTLESCPKLKALNFNFFQPFPSKNLKVLENCKALKYLNLNVWDELKYVPQLYLSINNCDKITVNFLISMIAKCTSLNYLEMYEVGGDVYIWSEMLSKQFSQRPNVFNLVVKKGDVKERYPKKCKVHECKISYGETYYDFTNVHKQYFN